LAILVVSAVIKAVVAVGIDKGGSSGQV